MKAAEKDPSATVVASVHPTGATLVGITNVTEFWQRQTPPSSFLLLLSHKTDLAIPLYTHTHIRGRGGGMISHLCQIFSFCYTFQRINTSRTTQIERTGKSGVFFMYHVLNQMTVNVKIVVMEHLWCDFLLLFF